MKVVHHYYVCAGVVGVLPNLCVDSKFILSPTCRA